MPATPSSAPSPPIYVPPPSALPELVRSALGQGWRSRSASEACAELAALYGSLSAGALQRLDRQGRQLLPQLRLETLGSVEAVLRYAHGWTIAAALSAHGNGYLRERATAWLAEERSGHEIPLLLLRLNDWVAPIRERAAEALRTRLHRPWAAGWLTALPLLRRAKRWGRGDHTPFLLQVATFLRRPELTTDRAAALRDRRLDVRREVFALCVDCEPERLPALIRQAADDASPWLRRWALARLERLPALCQPELLERFLLQPSLAERQTAQRLARQHLPGYALDTFYRAALARPKATTAQRRAALFGLGECAGGGDDLARVMPWLEHERTTLQRAALYALVWLDGEAQGARLVELLATSRQRLSNDAANALCRAAHLVEGQGPRLRELAGDARRAPHVQRNATRVLEAGAAYRRRWADTSS